MEGGADRDREQLKNIEEQLESLEHIETFLFRIILELRAMQGKSSDGFSYSYNTGEFEE